SRTRLRNAAMTVPLRFASLFFLFLAGSFAPAEAPATVPGDKDPLLRLEAGGPTAYVTALALNREGTRLYAAGWDKVVRVWNLQNGKFVLSTDSYRVPIAPGISGAINAIALSEDEHWLAVAGLGVFRRESGARKSGYLVPDNALDPEE